jgi:WD40 repeat protein
MDGVACFTFAGEDLVVGSDDKSISVIGTKNGRHVARWELPDYPTCLCQGRLDHEILVGTLDGMLLVIDMKSGKITELIKLSNTGISKVLWCNGIGPIYRGNDGLVRTLQYGVPVEIFGESAADLCNANADHLLVIREVGGSLEIVDLTNREIRLARPDCEASSLSLNVAHGLCAFTGKERLAVLGLNDDFDTMFTTAKPQAVTCSDISPNGRLVLAGLEDGVRVWDIFVGKSVLALESERPVYSVTFAPDGNSIYVLNWADQLLQFP